MAAVPYAATAAAGSRVRPEQAQGVSAAAAVHGIAAGAGT